MIDVQINKKHYKDVHFLAVNAGITGSQNMRDPVGDVVEKGFTL